MANETLSGRLIIGTHPIFPHISKDGLEYCLIFFDTQETVRICYDGMRPSGIESGDNVALSVCSDRILGLVAIVPGLVHPDDRLHALVHESCIKTAETNQVVADFVLFKFQLFFVG